jgi:hypothetical protein
LEETSQKLEKTGTEALSLLKTLGSTKAFLFTCSIKNELVKPARFLWNKTVGIEPST